MLACVFVLGLGGPHSLCLLTIVTSKVVLVCVNFYREMFFDCFYQVILWSDCCVVLGLGLIYVCQQVGESLHEISYDSCDDVLQ